MGWIDTGSRLRLVDGAVAALFLLLVLLRIPDAAAALTRNLGALHLVNTQAADHLDQAERRLNMSSTWLETPATGRLMGVLRQAQGDIPRAMQEWRDAGLAEFALNVGLRELARADAAEAPLWEKEVLAIIARPGEWQRLGTAYAQRGEDAKAVDAYRQSLALAAAQNSGPGAMHLAESYYSLAQIYKAQYGDTAQAVEAYTLAVEAGDFANPWHRVLSHHELAMLLLKADPARAMREARVAVALMPEFSLAHSVLGLAIYAASGDLPQAEQEVRAAIALDPQSVWPWMHLGQLFAQAQQYTAAEEAYLQAAALNPQFKEAQDLAAFIRKTYLSD